MSARGYALLPVAALFGVVRSSDVVGVDEKYVLVPKNDKPASKMRRWMYVYLAVDVWTYDLLHITARFIKKTMYRITGWSPGVIRRLLRSPGQG